MAQSIDHELTIDDLVAYNLYFIKNVPAQRRVRLLAKYVMPASLAVLCLAGMLYSRRRNGEVNELLWFCAAVVVVYTAYVWLWYDAISRRRLRAMYAAGRNTGLIGPMTVQLRPDSLWRQTSVSEGWVKWKAVTDIQSDGEYLFISLGVGSAYIIPRRAFADQTAFDSFAGEARRLWQANSA